MHKGINDETSMNEGEGDLQYLPDDLQYLPDPPVQHYTIQITS